MRNRFFYESKLVSGVRNLLWNSGLIIVFIITFTLLSGNEWAYAAEVCSPVLGNNCPDGQKCTLDIGGICYTPRKVGEECVLFPCADGLSCVATLGIVGDNAFTCFPEESDTLYPDNVCLSLYSEDLHKTAQNIGTTMTYGAGSGTAALASFANELGTVYDGINGFYGCYITSCKGLLIDVEIASSVCVGFYDDYENFYGKADVLVEEVGLGVGLVAAFSTTQMFDLDNSGYELIGTSDCLSIEVSPNPFPFSAGWYDCSTIVDTVAVLDDNGDLVDLTNDPPIALCNSVTTCADAVTCMADADINNGSYDPDGDSINYSQTPPRPYGLGLETVILTVTDPQGATDSCDAEVNVNDCTAPEILEVTVDPSLLWSPNHKMVSATVSVTVSDACDLEPVCKIVEVSSNEESRLTTGDWKITGDLTLEVRAERNGNGTGRVYPITVECVDASGNASQSNTEIIVPHDMSE